MKTITYSCPYVPAEWIAAHGLKPSRILPSGAGRRGLESVSPGLCAYVSGLVDEVCPPAAGDAVILTTACDHMRRSAELIGSRCSKPVFLMHVPTSWQSVVAQKLYRSELRRLGRFLVRLGGRGPSGEKLADTMREYNRTRSALREARGRLTARQYSEAIAHFHSEGEPFFSQPQSASARIRLPVALVGGPLMAHHFSIFDSIEEAGGTVVLDATTSGERTLPRPFELRRLRGDPFEELADGYFGCIPDAFRRPNSMLYQWLKKELAQRGVRGIVFRYYLGCDTWHAEAQRLKEWADMPVYILDSEGEESISPRTVNGLGSFLEMLK